MTMNKSAGDDYNKERVPREVVAISGTAAKNAAFINGKTNL